MELLVNDSNGKTSDNGNRGNGNINIEDLTVWTPEEKSWWRRKPTKAKTIILNNVTGCIKQGEFVAILGPSGAGKTTFLVSLAGKCTLPSEGVVTVHGTNVKDLKQGVVEIVPQFDAFMNSLSVMEHLVFMTEMKLGSCKKSSNRMRLNSLISELKLKAHVDTPIGSLSGGERRLLSLAGSLLSSPQIVICDEPTTGLDSYNASLVIGILKKLSQCGRVVICSIHQPSSDLFNEFNYIMLMAEGRLVFHGSQYECKELFESLNLYCPKNYNPAEFYIRAVSSNPNVNDNYVERISDAYRDRSRECVESGPGSPAIPENQFKRSQRNWFIQIQLLTWRSSLTIKRDIRDHIFQLFIYMMASSMIITTCYIGISGTTQRGIQDFRGFLWLLSSEICYGLAYNALYVFETDMTLFKREVGMYSASAFFASRLLNYIPRCIIWPVTFVVLATLAVQLPNHVVTAMEIMVALIGAALAATSFGLGMGALFTSTGIMGDVMPCVDLPLFLMSGAFLRISTIPQWLYPVRYISHFYYAMDAVSNIYWRQIDYIECPGNATTVCVKDGLSVLAENGYSSNFIFQDSFGLLFVTLFWSFLGYYGLKREENKGYAY